MEVIYSIDEIKSKIRNYLSGCYNEHEIADDEDIFKLGFVNVLFAVKLVTFIQKEFDITVNTTDIDFPDFMNINSIASFVVRKINGSRG